MNFYSWIHILNHSYLLVCASECMQTRFEEVVGINIHGVFLKQVSTLLKHTAQGKYFVTLQP